MNVRLCLRVHVFSVLLRSLIKQPCKFIAWRDQLYITCFDYTHKRLQAFMGVVKACYV